MRYTQAGVEAICWRWEARNVCRLWINQTTDLDHSTCVTLTEYHPASPLESGDVFQLLELTALIHCLPRRWSGDVCLSWGWSYSEDVNIKSILCKIAQNTGYNAAEKWGDISSYFVTLHLVLIITSCSLQTISVVWGSSWTTQLLLSDNQARALLVEFASSVFANLNSNREISRQSFFIVMSGQIWVAQTEWLSFSLFCYWTNQTFFCHWPTFISISSYSLSRIILPLLR